MIIKAGKYYRTKLGAKVFIVWVAPEKMDTLDNQKVVGYIQEYSGLWELKCWRSNGKRSSFGLSDIDIWGEYDWGEYKEGRFPGDEIK